VFDERRRFVSCTEMMGMRRGLVVIVVVAL